MAYTSNLVPGSRPLTLTGWACDANLVTGTSTVTISWKAVGTTMWQEVDVQANEATASPVYCLGDHGFVTDLSFLPGFSGTLLFF
jgi:hypothetical protein